MSFLNQFSAWLSKSLAFRFWRILKPFRKIIGGFILLLVFYEGIKVVESYTLSFALKLFEWKVEYYFWVVLLVALLVYDEIFMRLDNNLDWYIISKQGYPLYRFLKLGAIKKFLEMDLSWHQKRNSGTLVGKVADGVWKTIEVIDLLSWEFVPTIIQAFLSMIPLFFLSPISALISVATFLLFAKLSLANLEARKPFKEKRYDNYEEEWHRSIEIVQSVETNYMFGQTERLIKEQEKLHDEIVKDGCEESRLGLFRYTRWQIRIMRLASRAVLGIMIYQLYIGALDVPNLIFANVLVEKLFSSFWRFSRLLDRAAESAEGARRLAIVLEEEPVKIIDGSVTKAPVETLGIELNNVRFSYSGRYAPEEGGLHDLSLEIPPGQVVALVGPSGSGKTTVRKVVTALMGIQEGQIKVGKVDLSQWSSTALLSQFSYVPQGDDVFLYNDTVRNNIAFARPEATLEEIIRAAQLAGIHDYVLTLPDTYETLVGERGKRLSGGQKQRIALARAIIADRPILILDEATSSVDAITEEEIQERMKEILAGKTAVIIAHRLSTIWDIADKIIVLDRGRKVEEGTHEELVKLGGLYAKMAALQTKEQG